ncbi:MAG: oligosaccharide flippase family protein [Ruminococcus sp.]|nr:oligosaccharide flippase family protein [Ruminococcus sp.]
MNENSRIANTSKNVITSLINQIITLILAFVSRTIFIRYLGVEYLGINSLFANVLQVLSMADLGFGTAIVYSMYKPIRENDHEKLAALTYFYKKAYNIIALVVLLVGLLIVPILPYIVKMDSEIPHLTLYYVIYLMNTVVSYLCVYKSSITIAQQKSYILNNYDSVFVIVQNVIQILVIIYLKSFIVYLIVQVLVNLVRNVYKASVSVRMNPYIKQKIELSKDSKTEIFGNIKSMFIYKIGGVILNSTDNILISAIVGTIYVGFYANYLMVVNAVLTFTNLVFNSMTASIGDLNADSDSEKKLLFFNRINFIAVWLFSFCGACFLTLFQDFIQLWLGSDYLLDFKTLIVIVLNFVMPGTIRTVSLYRDTTGIFKKTKYVFFVTAVINLILSIVFGKMWGLFGILLATVLSRVSTNMWFEPFILFKDYFKKDCLRFYFIKQIKYWFVFALICSITYSVNFLLPSTSYLCFIIKILLCVAIPNLLLVLLYHRTKEYHYILSLVGRYIKKLKK